MFKKPKKIKVRRRSDDNDEKVEIADEPKPENRKKDKDKDKDKSIKSTKPSLLSFNDEEEEGEVFQVKKSNHSKRLFKEKRLKKKSLNTTSDYYKDSSSITSNNFNSSNNYENSSGSVKQENTDTKNSNLIQEIRTENIDGFVLVVKNSDPDKLILNGRAAFCAGRDDMSSEEDEEQQQHVDNFVDSKHKFSQPENFNFSLESGIIPDAAMIHAARKRRQKAREQGEFISIEDTKEEQKKGKRNVHEEEVEGDGSDEEEQRVDMSGITGVKEREERREKFYSVQQDYSEEDSDMETNEWENQQIRKGVTGAQLISAQQESIYSQYLIQPFSNSFNSNGNGNDKSNLSTAQLLEQAYSHTNYEIAKHKHKQITKETKTTGPRTPKEIVQMLKDKLCTAMDLNRKHFNEIDRITADFKAIEIDLVECEENVPVAAGKYRFYQELKGYISDLVECLDEKLPAIVSLEERSVNVMAQYSKRLIERRRQDVRDQAKEVTETKTFKKTPDDEERVRRAAEREGRRTRRRRDREKLNMNEIHNDGMSSDEEVPDIDLAQYKAQLSQIKADQTQIFDDVSEEYCVLSEVLQKFEAWRYKEIDAYKEAFVNLCLPKIVSIFVREKLVFWSPFDKNYEDIEKMNWYKDLAFYAKQENESEESLRNDPDVFLIPTVVEKIILPKLNKIIEDIWDPLSTTQTLRLVGLMNRLTNEYPSLRITSKPLQSMFTIITDKMKLTLENDVFIPIFQKQNADSKSSFFQRQFYSGIKLFRNFMSFQGIISDSALKNLAISSLLNRYLLSAMRVATPIDGTNKAYTIVLTMPRVWLISSDKSLIESMSLFLLYVKSLESQLDKKNPLHLESIEKLKHILGSLQLREKM